MSYSDCDVIKISFFVFFFLNIDITYIIQIFIIGTSNLFLLLLILNDLVWNIILFIILILLFNWRNIIGAYGIIGAYKYTEL